VVQVAPAWVSFSHGTERLACLRLAPTGMYRFYAECCQTPVGNAISANVPFIGLAQAMVAMPASLAPAVNINRASSRGGPPAGSLLHEVGATAKAVALLASWKVRRLGQPSALFSPEGKAVVEPRVLSVDERAACTID
jgi:hypothetical protein